MQTSKSKAAVVVSDTLAPETLVPETLVVPETLLPDLVVADSLDQEIDSSIKAQRRRTPSPPEPPAKTTGSRSSGVKRPR